ncbi:hypothetical protein RJT34_11659 [Clitoria ternatea]|uniref:Uncharacterized protein n=1 Tax=Clitoria ternatea TaxID=43366 RepID=A0AAN9JN17_CLITE
MSARGFILGKDALNRANSFDEKHQLSSTTTTKVVSLDNKVSEKTKLAISATKRSVASAGYAIMRNCYMFTGVAWITGAYNKVLKDPSGNNTTTLEESIEIPPPRPKRKPIHPYPRKLVEIPKKEIPNLEHPLRSNSLKSSDCGQENNSPKVFQKANKRARIHSKFQMSETQDGANRTFHCFSNYSFHFLVTFSLLHSHTLLNL